MLKNKIVVFVIFFLLILLSFTLGEKKYTLHLIANNHIDPVWLWRWEEGLFTTRSIFSSVIEYMKKYPEFTFSASSALLYKWIEEVDLKLFQEIKKKVKEGRWCIVGGWWIEPDCNLPSGEALVRQGLYGQRYFLEKFGVKARVGYNPDAFGHNLMLPQILKKMDIDYYVFLRPEPYEKKLESDLFFWESPDKSKVIAYRITNGCNIWGKELEKNIKIVSEKFNEKLNSLMIFYGAGDFINTSATEENIEIIRNLMKKENKFSLKFSTPNVYFEEISKSSLELPVVKDELQYHARGCYSALSWVKKNNRELEYLLLTGEKLSVLGSYLKNIPYPREKLSVSWKNFLFTQFHDILAGTCIKEAYEDVKAIYGSVKNTLNEIITFSIQNIGKEINTQGEGLPIIVFNPTSFERKVPIEIEIPWKNRKIRVLDKEEKSVLFQEIKTSSVASSGRKKLIFIAKLPAYGYTLYRLVPRDFRVNFNSILNVKENKLENNWLYLEIDPKTGYIKRFYDKENKKEILSGYGAIPVVIEDKSDTWGHNVEKFKKEIGKFKISETKVIEKGPLRGILRVRSKFNNSTLIQDIIMYRDLKYVEVRVTVDWHEKLKMLKLKFPVNLKNPKGTYQIPYGFIERPNNGEENPGQEWIDLSDTEYGLTLINDAKYSYDIEGNVLSLTILRSPVFAHHVPKKLDLDEEYTYLDQGEQSFVYLLLPHKKGWREANVVKMAESLNTPPIISLESNHDGKLPQERSFINIDKKNVIATVIKLHEDGKGIVVRVYETIGKATEVKMTLFNRSWNFKLNANEIKTFLIPLTGKEKIKEVNLLEYDN